MATFDEKWEHLKDQARRPCDEPLWRPGGIIAQTRPANGQGKEVT
jgi:hypothetical protein